MARLYENENYANHDYNKSAYYYYRHHKLHGYSDHDLKHLAEDHNCGDAYAYLGEIYLDTFDPLHDTDEAFICSKKAVELGSKRGLYTLGRCYEFQFKYKRAVENFQKAADYLIPEAVYWLGKMYDSGKGFKKDHSKALSLYTKAANSGCAEAQDTLGDMYFKGQHVDQSYKTAYKWYLRAAEEPKMFFTYTSLAKMYENGTGVEKDEAKALEWYEKSAKYDGDAGKSKIRNYLHEIDCLAPSKLKANVPKDNTKESALDVLGKVASAVGTEIQKEVVKTAGSLDEKTENIVSLSKRYKFRYESGQMTLEDLKEKINSGSGTESLAAKQACVDIQCDIYLRQYKTGQITLDELKNKISTGDAFERKSAKTAFDMINQ